MEMVLDNPDAGYVNAQGEDAAEDAPAPFAAPPLILDDQSAEMSLRRIRKANQESEEMISWWEHQIDRATQKRDFTVGWHERALRSYFAMVPFRRLKTMEVYDLPSGKLQLKHPEPEYKKVDEAALVAWCREAGYGAYVRTKETVDWASLKKDLKITSEGETVLTADGELVPGMKVIPRDDQFVVTLK